MGLTFILIILGGETVACRDMSLLEQLTLQKYNPQSFKLSEAIWNNNTANICKS
jgi:hypothetical protein